MRIVRYTTGDDPSYGVLQGEPGSEWIAQVAGDPLYTPVSGTGQRVDLDDVRLLAPVIPRSKIIGIGRNYAAHAAELGNEVPKQPLMFFIPNTAVVGPDDPVIIPPATQKCSYEGELAVVIGRMCKDVPVERVPEVIFGYTCANDVTARDLQEPDRQWARAKGFDTFCPLGPWIVTHLSLDEVGELSIGTVLNGEQQQASRTSLMVRGVAELIEFVSGFTTLLPGDVILTGTPEGVGPMQPGDEVSVTIESIGTLTNPVVAEG